ncbi:MurR/RpiR family transcriptional regulator [Vagococcus intermedius]|uniref:MurR/RpiR family transcriptional regulator n=1 Tax=Vagococcus intermedius TaxID=2991418 RepID=A0AAF0IA10_9ENTE|nr:MurR/RpiR family transcriptional regulator [Vagococcus intermedius]WEG74012.1 MurR/RpiR family transcriptional regulator [Vagococcus intermedius]WEG76092.1 MurR/RpiR family transcriptional regulator [Vagococcus intermedius]
MLLTEKLKQPIFSTTERLVIDYLLEQRLAIANKTIKEISNETFISPSILIRISNKLGYRGWTAFKKEFLEEVNYLDTHFNNIDANFPFTAKDSCMKIANKVGTLVQETVTDTLHLLHHDDLSQAIRLLDESPQIKIFTSNINIYLAQDFAHKMTRIKKNISIVSLDGEKVFEAANANENVLAFLISYSGENSSITHLLPILKKNKVQILSLTNMGENTIANASNCSLKISTREKLYSKVSGFSSHHSICLILDILYSGVFSLNYQTNLDHNILISKMNDPRCSKLETLKEERSDM